MPTDRGAGQTESESYGWQPDGSYNPCPECFTLPDGGCGVGGHEDDRAGLTESEGDVMASSVQPMPDPYRCGDEGNDGDFCDLQPAHDGTMHSGVRPDDDGGHRIWWDATTGDLMDFSK